MKSKPAGQSVLFFCACVPGRSAALAPMIFIRAHTGKNNHGAEWSK